MIECQALVGGAAPLTPRCGSVYMSTLGRALVGNYDTLVLTCCETVLPKRYASSPSLISYFLWLHRF